jgi:hypothetical protein
MAPSSASTKASPSPEPATGHRIIDVVEVRTSYGAPAPGFILVPEGFRPTNPEALTGEVVVIEPPGGWAILGTIAGSRDHGPTTSLLVENWPTDFPTPRIGWMIRVPSLEASCYVVDEAG